MDVLLSGETWAAFLSLTALEIVLGIDNLVFLSVTAARLPVHRRAMAQRVGLILALAMRIGLLASAVWLAGLTEPLVEAFGVSVSWRDAIMLAGGLFLLIKGTSEIAVMMFAATPVSKFIEAHPTAKMLALSFLMLIGVALIADGLQFHIPRGYLYFAIAFSMGVEGLNLWAKARRKRLATAKG